MCADAVRKNTFTSRATNVEIELYMKKWLRNAADRMGGGRSKRMKKMLKRRTGKGKENRSENANRRATDAELESCSGSSVISSEGEN